ncbi:hemerythrin domain-containing protein [Flavihumibacter fluvii]|uniref:hemerythrin domain-containing protein n=1 Tax=Flavihumibacter fluvii TaxID=2838157 RepID=UPI001BDDFE20|nr:hemerythrin domain-containing protein [Flavihumibacter fluvii]ULQ53173.1 hemerythrin domain-containing protein [Flavihumibacter fluvii]
MERYNIFNQVHKGLRVLLYETATSLQQTDFFDIEATAATLSQLESTIELFEKHAATEDNFLFGALQRYEPSIIDAFTADHQEDAILGNRLRGLITALLHAVTTTDKQTIGASITAAFVDFMVFNLEHMAEEEDIINKILWQHYTDAELHGITARIVASIPPTSAKKFNTWMMRGLNNSEIITWLKNVRHNAPEFIYQDLLLTAMQELIPQRWKVIREELTEQPEMA